ncbi:c-type cytochrome [Campylobacter sp. RM12647]|uniref:c-type cytochrome n=1 Tax=Campylobacter sp. RM12647 TaxID=2735737 RepID=UPI001DED1FB4|nr:c-type cytochrome [Campylobacter sp. RM12647]
MKKILLFLCIINSINAVTTDDLLNYTFSDNLDINLGKELFINIHKCNSCHGDLGDKSSTTFKSLNTYSASTLKSMLKSYKNDKDFGGKTRFVMQRYANKLSNKDIDNIIAYIKGKDNLELPNSKHIEPAKKTKDNLYLE